MIPVTIYSRPGCHLCEVMKDVVRQAGTSIPLAIDEIDISTDPELERLYGMDIPVLFVAGKKVAKYRVTEQQLLRILSGQSGAAG